jgi:hypothetical protein
MFEEGNNRMRDTVGNNCKLVYNRIRDTVSPFLVTVTIGLYGYEANMLSGVYLFITSVCFYRFYPRVVCNYTVALEKLGLYARGDITLMLFFCSGLLWP